VFGDLDSIGRKRYILTGNFARTHIDAIQVGQAFNFSDEDGPDDVWQVTKMLPTPVTLSVVRHRRQWCPAHPARQDRVAAATGGRADVWRVSESRR
jgi:hypothetical protein